MKNSQIARQWENFIRIVKAEVKPALGCTEPVSLALAAAVAAMHLKGKAQRVDAWVSPNLMKNGMGVTIPGTGQTGLPVAAALGALCGAPEDGLEVLKNVTPDDVNDAMQWIEHNRVQVSIEPDCNDILYSRARVWDDEENVTVTIAGHHTNIIRIEQGGNLIYCAENTLTDDGTPTQPDMFHFITLGDILTFAEQAPFDDIRFILEAATLNEALSQEGLRHEWGLHIGATLVRQRKQNLIGHGLLSGILIRTSAASDARMGGASLPAMSNSGSGNQGIAATLPVLVVAEHVEASQETLARALMLSHLTAIYIHSKLPTLSALCAATTASMGAAAGMAWLMGGNLATLSMAINSMVGDVSGIICDGASGSCAMKVSTSAGAAWKAVLMALDHSSVSGHDGIVCGNVEDSLNNLGALACRSMQHTDTQIIDIMVKKAS